MPRFGYRKPTGLRRRVNNLRYRLARRLMGRYAVKDDGYRYDIACLSSRELSRIASLFVKEEGTVALIRREVAEGDVFCDIGANIGLYSLMAAARVGDTGCVYAFEPLAPNFARLLEHIEGNGFTTRVVPFSLALNDQSGFFPFHCRSLESGASGSQLHEPMSDQEEVFAPQATEMKYAASLDSLVCEGVVMPPTVVKIDVDGNEARILRGMAGLLTGENRPRVLSVEVNAREKPELFGFMESCGYAFADRNDTLGGRRKMRRGVDPEAVAYNAIFRPVEENRH